LVQETVFIIAIVRWSTKMNTDCCKDVVATSSNMFKHSQQNITK